MIQEQYVSFETAKLLKEKGFDGECETSYYISNEGCENAVSIGDFTKVRPWRDALIAAPTQQMAMRWLREKGNIIITIKLNTSIYTERISYSYITYILYERWFHKEYVSGGYFSYEEACEAAIKYCLKNLI